MSDHHTSDLPTLLRSLERSFSSNLFASLPPQLTRAKLLLTTNNLLTPAPNTPPAQIALARTVFEIGAYTAIRLRDKAAFVTYLGYLQNFYALGLGGDRQPELTGLNLLRLLAENKIAEFHTQLEIIDATAKSVGASGPVKFARGLEEWIMEGAYNRVWKAGEGTGVSVYQKFFLDVLMDTIRNEIATCLERAYPSLPISDTQILLFFPPQDNAGFRAFAKTREWSISNMGIVSFPPPAASTLSSSADDMTDVPEHLANIGGLDALYAAGGDKVLKAGLDYAGELEKVI